MLIHQLQQNMTFGTFLKMKIIYYSSNFQQHIQLRKSTSKAMFLLKLQILILLVMLSYSYSLRALKMKIFNNFWL